MSTTLDFRLEEIKFMPEINKIVKDNFWLFPAEITNINLSTEEEDTKESFDLVYNSKVEISVRIRGYKYWKEYCDFTIRNKSKYNNKTELHKLIEGKGSLYLYAWKTMDEQKLYAWVLIDINKIRSLLSENGKQRYNYDNTAFKAYSLSWANENNAILNFENIPVL